MNRGIHTCILKLLSAYQLADFICYMFIATVWIENISLDKTRVLCDLIRG